MWEAGTEAVSVQVENVLNAEERALEREAKKGMNEDEAVFSVESALEQTYEWSDKYRPRKPRSVSYLPSVGDFVDIFKFFHIIF
jgi:hypothetical protein